MKFWKFSAIQGFCKAEDVSANGARAELETRLVEFKDKQDAGDVASPIIHSKTDAHVSTPEGSPDRLRSPHRGNAELRRSVLMGHPEPLELDDDSFADGPVRELPAAPVLQNFDKF